MAASIAAVVRQTSTGSYLLLTGEPIVVQGRTLIAVNADSTFDVSLGIAEMASARHVHSFAIRQMVNTGAKRIVEPVEEILPDFGTPLDVLDAADDEITRALADDELLEALMRVDRQRARNDAELRRRAQAAPALREARLFEAEGRVIARVPSLDAYDVTWTARPLMRQLVVERASSDITHPDLPLQDAMYMVLGGDVWTEYPFPPMAPADAMPHHTIATYPAPPEIVHGVFTVEPRDYSIEYQRNSIRVRDLERYPARPALIVSIALEQAGVGYFSGAQPVNVSRGDSGSVEVDDIVVQLTTTAEESVLDAVKATGGHWVQERDLDHALPSRLPGQHVAAWDDGTAAIRLVDTRTWLEALPTVREDSRGQLVAQQAPVLDLSRSREVSREIIDLGRRWRPDGPDGEDHGGDAAGFKGPREPGPGGAAPGGAKDPAGPEGMRDVRRPDGPRERTRRWPGPGRGAGARLAPDSRHPVVDKREVDCGPAATPPTPSDCPSVPARPTPTKAPSSTAGLPVEATAGEAAKDVGSREVALRSLEGPGEGRVIGPQAGI